MDRSFAEPLRAAVQEALSSGILAQEFREQVVATLRERPGVLHPDAPLRAAKLAVGGFEAAGGTGSVGVQTGAAAELMMTAAHLLDRLADDDGDASSGDLQVAPALLFLTGIILNRIHASAGLCFDWSPLYIRMTTVCSGQQADINLQDDNYPTLEAARLMTENKTGAFGEAITLAGAIGAGACPTLQAQLGKVGNLLGTCSQLIDDASDASTRAPTTSDISLRKKTVPIAYFLGCRGDRADWDKLRDRFLDRGLSMAEERMMRLAIEESGALQLTLTLGNWYRMKAESALDALDAQGCETRLLREMACELRNPELPRSELAAASVSGFTD